MPCVSLVDAYYWAKHKYRPFNTNAFPCFDWPVLTCIDFLYRSHVLQPRHSHVAIKALCASLKCYLRHRLKTKKWTSTHAHWGLNKYRLGLRGLLLVVMVILRACAFYVRMSDGVEWLAWLLQFVLTHCGVCVCALSELRKAEINTNQLADWHPTAADANERKINLTLGLWVFILFFFLLF